KQGQAVLSPEVSPVAVLLTALGLAAWGAPLVVDRSRLVLARWLAAAGPAAARDDATGPLVAGALVEMAHVLVPFFLATAVVGAGAVIAQVGWSVNGTLLAPDLTRLSPARAWKRIFSAAGAMNLVKAVVKIAIVLGVAWHVLRRVGAEAVATPAMTSGALL